MAGVKVFILLFLYCLHLVRSNECITYDFEKDVDTMFTNDTGSCARREVPSWQVRKYSDVGLPSPHPRSKTFVSPPFSTFGCSTTFKFTMLGGGTFPNTPNAIIEVNIYLNTNSTRDHIVMNVEHVDQNGVYWGIGQAFVTAPESNFVSGWQKLRVTRVAQFGTVEVSLVFQGVSGTENSLVVVDSFRVIPPDMDEDACVIYEDIQETTKTTVTEPTTPITTEITKDPTTTTESETTITESTTETNVITTIENTPESTIKSTTAETIDTTTEQTDNLEKCVTYNFETDYDILFSTDHYLCAEFLPWQLDNYTNVGIDSPNPGSTVFITPHADISCISSIVFKMEPGGTVEAKVFMEPRDDMDHIIVQAYKVTDREYDTIAGLNMYHQDIDAFVFGWNTISFTIFEPSAFDGYLIFIGSADKQSTVLVDSVRYIPPLTPSDHNSCNLY